MSITKASLIDLNGQELILDADADTSITADTDDQIDIKIVGSDVITLTSIVDYEQPKAVNLIIAKMTEGILAEGQKIPMEKEGNYYTGEIFFENSGVYVYSIEVDTGHGKLKSIEQTLIVSEKQTIAAEEEPQSILPNIGLLPVISILLLIASRRRKL